MYKILFEDRTYDNHKFYEIDSLKKVELNINPIECKLFYDDVFRLIDNKVEIIYSTTRKFTSIAGVLIMKGNKTYGRHSNGKLLYKCIPDDKRLLPFLVPYENKDVSFSKVFVNIYVTFTYLEWKDKHPYGILSQVIGKIDNLNCFYEYQLYCKSLNASIQKFAKSTQLALKDKNHEEVIEAICRKHPEIEDRTGQEWYIFTIDPNGSTDFDDGFSIKVLGEDSYLLSIYIANVSILLDELDLWETFSKRISTIYLPDKKRPMLPSILSDCLCSLQEKNSRLSFVLDIYINNGVIERIKYLNCKIKVSKNYCYEEPELLENKNYNELMRVTKLIYVKFRYTSKIKDSHDLVGYLMILMNYYSAKELINHKNGIFRNAVIKREVIIPENLDEDMKKFLKIWNSVAGQYINGEDIEMVSLRHDLLELDAYIHITSPIRRLVDLLNMIKFQENNNMIKLSSKAQKFYVNWINELDYINTTMRAIRKVQCDCSLLDLCVNDPSVMEKEYEGYYFDKIERNDGLFQFIVYLPQIKLSSRVTTRENLDNYTKSRFKLYLFNNEEKFKKKIRLQCV